MVFPFIAPVVAAVVSAVSAIGPAVAQFASMIVPTLTPYLAKGMDLLLKVTNVAELVAQFAGVLKPGEGIANMGERALQAADAGIHTDQFGSVDEYLDALRQRPLDPEKKHDPATSLLSGLAVVSSGLDERLKLDEGTAGSLWPLVAIRRDYFTPEKIQQVLQHGQDIRDMVDYFSGKLGGAESLKVEDQLVHLDHEMDPGADDNTLRQQICAVQESCEHPEGA